MIGTISQSWLTPLLCAAISFVTATSAVTAEEPLMVAWKTQLGTSEHDFSNSVVVDAWQNIYIAGSTEGNLAGPNAGDADAFLMKLDANRNELWQQQIGTSVSDRASSVALDALGNTYITGGTEGSLGGPNAGSKDAFLIKFDTEGNEQWRRQVGTNREDSCCSVAVDASENVYIAGTTEGSLGGTYAGNGDAFLVKFDTEGNEQWRRQIGTSNYDVAKSVAVDAMGATYITGFTYASLGGPNAGEWDAFLIKFDTEGNEQWRQQVGTSKSDYSYSVTIDATGNAFITGTTYGSLSGPYAGGRGDAFLIKFDTEGNELWRWQVGTSGEERSYEVTVDTSGNIYSTGFTNGSLTGSSAEGENSDAFLIKLDSTGTELWRRQIGTSSSDSAYSVAVDAFGDAYITGNTFGSLGAPHAGCFDAFLIKYDAEGVTGCINGDGDVDLDDFVILKTNFGSTSATRSQGDLNGDGDVDLEDFVILKANFGTSR